MKTKDETLDLLDQEFEYIGVIDEPLKQPLRVASLWPGGGRGVWFTHYPTLPVKKFNKEEIQALEAKMKKEGRL